MADNSQTSNNNNTQSSEQNAQTANQSNNSNAAINSGWVTVNTSDSAEAQRMNIMKGNNDELFTKSGR
jgi:hypothetical protein